MDRREHAARPWTRTHREALSDAELLQRWRRRLRRQRLAGLAPQSLRGGPGGCDAPAGRQARRAIVDSHGTRDASRAPRRLHDQWGIREPPRENCRLPQAGKAADFIILDRNLFSTPVHEIGKTRVLRTFLAGKEVYRAPASP